MHHTPDRVITMTPAHLNPNPNETNPPIELFHPELAQDRNKLIEVRKIVERITATIKIKNSNNGRYSIFINARSVRVSSTGRCSRPNSPGNTIQDVAGIRASETP